MYKGRGLLQVFDSKVLRLSAFQLTTVCDIKKSKPVWHCGRCDNYKHNNSQSLIFTSFSCLKWCKIKKVSNIRCKMKDFFITLCGKISNYTHIPSVLNEESADSSYFLNSLHFSPLHSVIVTYGSTVYMIHVQVFMSFSSPSTISSCIFLRQHTKNVKLMSVSDG